MSVDGGGGASSGSAADSVPGSPAQDAAVPAATAPGGGASPVQQRPPLRADTLLALLRYLAALGQAAGRRWGAPMVPQARSETSDMLGTLLTPNTQGPPPSACHRLHPCAAALHYHGIIF